MGIECDYGFWDLYRAAYGREAEVLDMEQLYALSQDERNEVVAKWAHMAGWRTDWRVGTDGLRYLAFYK